MAMPTSITRRELLRSGAIIGAGLLVPRPSMGESAEVQPETYTYKTVGDLSIKADVYRHRQKADRPVVVWIHGGALIGGHRGQVPRRVKEHILTAGYALISLDYRLAPETKLPDIIQDIEDAFAWIHR